MITRRLLALIVFVCIFGVPPAFAQQRSESYAGVGIGRAHVRFEPDYTFVLDGTPEKFLDEADGLQVDVVVGRRHRLLDRFWLGYQATLNINRADWSLSIPDEPAELRYSLPYAALGTVVPEMRVGGGISLFAEAGLGAGRVREIKTGSSYSVYDVDRMRGAFALGGGVKVGAGRRSALVVGWRRLSYSAFEYDSFNPAGVRIEHVKDAPCSTGFTAGFIVTF